MQACRRASKIAGKMKIAKKRSRFTSPTAHTHSFVSDSLEVTGNIDFYAFASPTHS
jgi:hypothetical protein